MHQKATRRTILLSGAAVFTGGAVPTLAGGEPDYTPIFEEPDPVSSPPDGGEVALPIIAEPTPGSGNGGPGGSGGAMVLARAAASQSESVRIDFRVLEEPPNPPALEPRAGHVMATFNRATGRIEAVIRLRKTRRGSGTVEPSIKIGRGPRRYGRGKRVVVQP